MNRLVTISVILFASMPLAGQNPPPKPASDPAQSLKKADRKPVPPFAWKGRSLSGDARVAMPEGGGCPVAMRAEHRGYGDMMTVDRGRDGEKGDSSGAVQRIHLTLGKGSDSARVVAVQITVHGTSNKPRTMAAEPVREPRSNGLPDAWRTLDLTFSDRERDEATADLLLRGFTSVTSITLDSLTFADGSMWLPVFGRACRITPDPLMLIADR